MARTYEYHRVSPEAEGLAFPPEEVKAAQERVYRKRRLCLMLLHVPEAKCLMPLVKEMDIEQMDAMLNLLSRDATLDNLERSAGAE